jgi:hypothetical protein
MNFFSVIGITHGECDSGSGAGSGFNVPDLVTDNRFPRSSGGSLNVGVTQTDQNLSHYHLNFYNAETSYASSPNLTSTTYIFAGMNGSGDDKYALRRTTTTANAGRDTSSGGAEARPNAIVLKYIIKYKGRAQQTYTEQQSINPDKAGFIQWAAFEADIPGFLKADGSCVKKVDYPDYVKNVGTLYGECTIDTTNDGVNLPDMVTENRYLRQSGGSLTTGTAQTDTNASHQHFTLRGGTASSDNTVGSNEYVFAERIVGTASGNYITVGTASVANVGLSSTSGSTESRPNTLVATAYVRMHDNNKVLGVFENINSSDLDKVIVSRTGSDQVITQNITTDVTFDNELKDVNNNFNPTTGVYTSTKDTTLLICFNYMWSSQAWGVGQRYVFTGEFSSPLKSVALTRKEILTTAPDFRQGGTCIEQDINAGGTFKVTVNQNSTGTRNLYSSAQEYVRMSIQELPDTESIVKKPTSRIKSD